MAEDPENSRARARPTVRAIAALAGVSHVTVSLALRNDPRISAATARRVRAIAKRAGYEPDPHVAELMGRLRLGRQGVAAPVIAWLGFVHAVYGAKGSPLERRLFRGAETRARQLGYRIERFTAGSDGLTPARISAILKARNIRGAIVAPLAEDAGRLALEWERMTTVAIGYSLRTPLVHRVCNHAAHTMRVALHELERRGCRRCGVYLREGLNARVDDAWLAAYFFHWHASHPGVAPIPPLVGKTWDQAEFAAWFRRHRPEAVVTIQLPVLGWLRELAAVPGEAAFVHLDWSPEMGDVAGIDQQSELVGAAGVEQVAAQLSQHDYGLPGSPKTVLIESVWRDGATARGAV